MMANATAPSSPPPMTDRTPSAVWSVIKPPAAIPMVSTKTYAAASPAKLNANTFRGADSAGR